ncbi:hypothetical protein TSAR_015215 [Trichomalopsis sarcophagae]|uniref:Uncharacterized protein n=1 Tax=Trichomalopsis sarcophagae TaxID=543379 RepID=A0A232EDC0_9HYME|nr:hypothetical protein TSAR_015215 [Trichomalopsis sarcophagae]
MVLQIGRILCWVDKISWRTWAKSTPSGDDTRPESGGEQNENTRGFLRSQNTNNVTATLPEVPGALGGQYQRRPQEFHEKSTTYFVETLYSGVFEVAEHETTLILFTLGTRYLRER